MILVEASEISDTWVKAKHSDAKDPFCIAMLWCLVNRDIPIISKFAKNGNNFWFEDARILPAFRASWS